MSYDEEAIKQESIKRPEARNERLGGKTAEERKRGRRLFGALLGTLSQSSSSSTAQKRRTDIEEKQQAKLKQQTEEVDEKKKEKLEKLMKARRKEQRVYDWQSVCDETVMERSDGFGYRDSADPAIVENPTFQPARAGALSSDKS